MATETAKTAAPVAKKAGAPKGVERVAPEFTVARADIAMPVSKKKASEIDNEIQALELNQSKGIKNKSKSQISARISRLNNNPANLRHAVDATGAPRFKAGAPIKDATGNVTSYQQEAVMEKVREWEAHDVNPKTDPDGASVRIWRTK